MQRIASHLTSQIYDDNGLYVLLCAAAHDTITFQGLVAAAGEILIKVRVAFGIIAEVLINNTSARAAGPLE